MKIDALPSPGLLPNAQRLRQEFVKTIGYLEVQKDVTGATPTQGASFAAFLTAALAYCNARDLITPA